MSFNPTIIATINSTPTHPSTLTTLMYVYIDRIVERDQIDKNYLDMDVAKLLNAGPHLVSPLVQDFHVNFYVWTIYFSDITKLTV